RRRHTRLQGDWSSDVCSSDLWSGCLNCCQVCFASHLEPESPNHRCWCALLLPSSRGEAARDVVSDVSVENFVEAVADEPASGDRSEERRVGKEGRTGG